MPTSIDYSSDPLNRNSIVSTYRATWRKKWPKCWGPSQQKRKSKPKVNIEITVEEIVKELIEKVFSFYMKLENIIIEISNSIKDKSDTILFETLILAFQSACNKNPLISNFLVYYADNILKREDSV